jgi:hypothetical protein
MGIESDSSIYRGKGKVPVLYLTKHHATNSIYKSPSKSVIFLLQNNVTLRCKDAKSDHLISSEEAWILCQSCMNDISTGFKISWLLGWLIK